jgi:hypothetical protein
VSKELDTSCAVAVMRRPWLHAEHLHDAECDLVLHAEHLHDAECDLVLQAAQPQDAECLRHEQSTQLQLEECSFVLLQAAQPHVTLCPPRQMLHPQKAVCCLGKVAAMLVRTAAP